MKATRYFAMAAAALAFAACSNDELASVGQHPAANGMKPVEFSTALSNVTRAQIMGESDLTEYWVQATGTFYKEDGSPVTNPKLTLTKSGDEWTYKVNSDDAASVLYWPMEDYSSTFAAWYYEGGSAQGALDNRSAQKDAIGAYATHSSDDEGNAVSLDFRHAVSKAVFQAKLHLSEGNTKVKIDIKEVAFHNVGYAATAYAAPTAETTAGAFTVNTTDKRDLVAARTSHSFFTEPAGTAAPAVTDLGTPMLVMPQEFTAQDLSAAEWNAPYISVLAQIRYDNGESLAIYPKNGGADDYAWVALPLPADFTGFVAHHKYIFTLNFRNDALGKVDRDQAPDDGTGTDDKVAEEDEGTDIVPPHSGIALGVTVEDVLDFEEDGDYEVNKPVSATDLSMLDCGGNARADGQWTANCYMVHTAGDYKLPLVYGNAIKAGETNAAAYTGVTGNSNATATFPRHDGEAITAPWIKDNGITVTTAELLWQDAEGLVTAVGISGDYLTLTVGKDATGQEGNAVVAAKDADGNIVWSWHIWVTKQTFAAADLTTVNTGSHNYTVTPVNLGWVSTSADGKQGYAPFYQWGRKDAFIPGTGEADTYTNHTVYDISGATVTGLTYTSSTTATIADNIKNPTTFYNVSNKPSTAEYFNLWDAQQTGSDNITTATKKTVYDPSPAGFCVPTGNLYYYFGNGEYRSMGADTWDSTNRGATWNLDITGNALFFPASGYRNNSNGSLNYVGGWGDYWSASAYGSNTNTARELYFDPDESSWSWNVTYRSRGLPVRAVAEE